MRIRTLLIISGAAVAVLTAGAFAFVKTGAPAGAAQAAQGLPRAEPSEPSEQAEPSAPPGGQSPGASPSPSGAPEQPREPEKSAKPERAPKHDDEPDAVAARIAPPAPEPEPERTGESRSGGSEKVLDSGSCKASFYGEGQMTASGERFDPGELTAAHKTLPFGSKVRVTNKGNGESVVVRVNDRGPYAGGRCLDLSEAAMKDIGGTSAGVISVRYEVLSRG